MWSAAQQPMTAAAPQQAANLKHDVFVGNLSFNTTEEQLHQAFSEIGRVINVRLVTDVETGKPRGFAFVEFQDPQAALSAIRNMNDYELNGRRLRVNFSNSSHLEVLAGKLGMDLSQQTQRPAAHQQPQQPAATSSGTNTVAESLKGMSKAEMYDVIEKLKEIADRDPDEARRIISSHPQLPEALLFLMSKLDMVKTPVAIGSAPLLAPPAPARAADPRAAVRVDPRQAAAAAAAAVAPPVPTPVAAAAPPSVSRDPRQRADPRAAAAVAARVGAPPPPMVPAAAVAPPLPPPGVGVSYGAPPPLPVVALPPQPPPPQQQQQQQVRPSGMAMNLDPALVQQVMSLTPQQIQLLPPDKQQSILQLRQQITGGL